MPSGTTSRAYQAEGSIKLLSSFILIISHTIESITITKHRKNIMKSIIIYKVFSPTVIVVLHSQLNRLEKSQPILTVLKKIFGRSTAKGKEGIADTPAFGGT